MFQEAPLRRTSGQSQNSGATRASRKASASRFPPPAGASPSLACFGTKFSPATEETCEGLNLVTEGHENRLFRAIVAKKLALLKNKPMHSSVPIGSAISSCNLVGHSRDLRAERCTRPLNCVICTNKAFLILRYFSARRPCSSLRIWRSITITNESYKSPSRLVEKYFVARTTT